MRLVGIIAAHWEYCDALWDRVVQEILDLKGARIVLLTQAMGLESKIDLVSVQMHKVFAEIRNDPASPLDAKDLEIRYKSVCEALRVASRTRSKFVHARWLFNEKTKELERHSTRTTKKHLDVAHDPTPIKELADAAQSIYATAQAIIDFFVPFRLLQSSDDIFQ